MKKILFYFFAICATHLHCFAEDWALTDSTLGWNSRELVTLYFHNSELQTQWAWEALSHYRFRGDEKVLDFGSGDGKLSALMSFMVSEGEIIGADLSEEMVFYASKMFPSSHYKNLTFKTSPNVDFAQVSFPYKFDLITSFCVFHLIPNPSEVLANLRSQLKHNGKLVLTLPTGGNPDFFQAASEVMARYGLSFPMPTSESRSMRMPSEAKALITAAGFDIEHFKVVKSNFSYGSREELIDWFEGTLSANWNIPANIRRVVFTDILDRYLASRPDALDDDGFVYFTIHRLDIVAANRV